MVVLTEISYAVVHFKLPMDAQDCRDPSGCSLDYGYFVKLVLPPGFSTMLRAIILKYFFLLLDVISTLRVLAIGFIIPIVLILPLGYYRHP